MCQKGSCAEGRVAVPTGRLCKARFGIELFACFRALRSGPCRGPESPTAGPPSVPPGRPHPGNAGKPGGPPGDGMTTCAVSARTIHIFYWAGLYLADCKAAASAGCRLSSSEHRPARLQSKRPASRRRSKAEELTRHPLVSEDILVICDQTDCDERMKMKGQIGVPPRSRRSQKPLSVWGLVALGPHHGTGPNLGYRGICFGTGNFGFRPVMPPPPPPPRAPPAPSFPFSPSLFSSPPLPHCCTSRVGRPHLLSRCSLCSIPAPLLHLRSNGRALGLREAWHAHPLGVVRCARYADLAAITMPVRCLCRFFSDASLFSSASNCKHYWT
jgi:hypothetical protein